MVHETAPKVAVLGEGAWGTAIALLLAHNDCDVTLWCHDARVFQDIIETGYNNRYMPGIVMCPAIHITTDMSEALQGKEWVFETTPITYLRNVLTQAKPYVNPGQTWVALSKGIEEHTLLLPTHIITDVLGQDIVTAVCMGPSFAKEVARQQITALMVAVSKEATGDISEWGIVKESTLVSLLANRYVRPYYSTDTIGVQVSAALKNVIALGIGMLDGAGYADNAKAFFLTCGLHEIASLAVAMGGKKETVYGLSGVGDLVLTCMGLSSKNVMVGKRLGAGHALHDILAETGFIPEGINTVKSVYQLMHKYKIALPICQSIHDILEGKITVDGMFTRLMQQPLNKE